MGGVNKAILVGRLGLDPEARDRKEGGIVTNLRVATSEVWGKGEARKEHTEWHRVVLFGRQAEVARDYLSKGSQVYVEGRLRTNEWTDKEGKKRRTTEIVGDLLQLLDRKRAENGVSVTQDTKKVVSDPGVFFGMSTA